MRILYYDCQAGISGDMNLAAMLALGVDPGFLRTELAKLGLENEFSLEIREDARNGIHGTRVDVTLMDTACAGQESGHAQGHVHDHNHGHDHEHDHAHDPVELAHAHGGRNLAAIEALLTASDLSEAVLATSLAIFRRLAAAEARVHGVPVAAVHFHEVGAVDALVDIVGAAICFHALGVDAVWASPVELGGGFVRCAHGLIPVPAPATVELLTGLPTTRGASPTETTTPTGAAILATLVDRFTDRPRLVVQKTGYGIGHRVTELSNLLRVHLAEVVEAPSGWAVSRCRLLQCNIDDMTGEMLGAAMDTLLAAGAMDVHFTPIVMKKNRPATTLSVLCAEADAPRFTDLLFRHTTTLGIKSLFLEKNTLETTFTRLDTPLGPVTMKNALRNGEIIRAKPEFEDCRQLAEAHRLPLAEVYAVIARSREGKA